LHQPVNGYCKPLQHEPEKGVPALHRAISNIKKPVFLINFNGEPAVCQDGRLVMGDAPVNDTGYYPLLSYAPSLHPKDLGSRDFKHRYNIKYPYVAGAMAQGISSVELVKAAGNAGMIGFFGSAGLPMNDLEKIILRLNTEAADIIYGMNLVFSGTPEQEMAIVDLYLKHGIQLISAAGYLRLSMPLIYYRLKGIHRNSDGDVVCPNKIIAKTSRLEIAKQFLSPPPEKIIKQLLEKELISENEASLAVKIPVAQDLTAEADSGGHTDNRSAVSLLPSMIDLRDKLYAKHQYSIIPCIGLGGGIATPKAVAAAFAMGADYVLSGSVNQACLESGTSKTVRQLLAKALQTDMIMAPSANMFERGIKVQVLKRGSLFAQRASRLYEIYRSNESLDLLDNPIKKELEEKIFQNSIESEWQMTQKFFKTYDPLQLEASAKDAKRKMSLVFRSYLGKSSKWAITGDPDRIKDYQIWCGPSMGAFNEWARNSFLADPENRDFETVAMNLLLGACVSIRRQWVLQGLASGSLSLPPDVGKFNPLLLSEINRLLTSQ